MGSAAKPTQHDRWSNLSKRSSQLRGGSRRGPEAKNTPTDLCQDPPQFCELNIKHGRHKKETTGSRGAKKAAREKPVGGPRGEEEEGRGGEEQEGAAGRGMLGNI